MADAPDMSKMLEQLMSDEKFGEILSAVKGSLSTTAENEPKSADTKDEPIPSPVPAIPNLSPELMAKLPEIMGMLSGGERRSDPHTENRKRLLYALKPFLSEGRQSAVDSIVNIAGIADLLGLQ